MDASRQCVEMCSKCGAVLACTLRVTHSSLVPGTNEPVAKIKNSEHGLVSDPDKRLLAVLLEKEAGPTISPASYARLRSDLHHAFKIGNEAFPRDTNLISDLAFLELSLAHKMAHCSSGNRQQLRRFSYGDECSFHGHMELNCHTVV